MTRVLITGAAGFLGRNLSEALARAGHAVTPVDRLERGAMPGLHSLPLTALDDLFGLMKARRIEVVVHLACGMLPSSNAEAFVREQHEVLAPSFALMDECARQGIRFVLFSSGGTVYGDAGPGLVHEAHALAPKNLYGYSKLVLEEYARLRQRSDGLPCLVLRPSNPYGAHQRLRGAQGLIAVAIGRVLSGEPLEIWGDGGAVRDYLDVRDLSAAVVALIEAGTSGCTLNVGSGVGHSILDVLEIVRTVTGRKLQVLRRPARGVDVRSVVLDTRALAARIPWAPRPLAAGVADFWRWIQAHGG
jgi:UDP-glucose 4-epimerase